MSWEPEPLAPWQERLNGGATPSDTYAAGAASSGRQQSGYGQPAPYAQPGYAQPGYAQSGYAQPYAQPGYAQPAFGQPLGQPGLAVPWAGASRVLPHRPWSTVLLWLNGLGVGLALLGVASAALLTGLGSAALPEGLAAGSSEAAVLALMGPVLLVVLGLAAAFNVVMLAVTVAGRRRADEGRPGMLQAAGWVAIVAGGLSVVGAVLSIANGDPSSGGGLLNVVLLVAGVKVVAATRS